MHEMSIRSAGLPLSASPCWNTRITSAPTQASSVLRLLRLDHCSFVRIFVAAVFCVLVPVLVWLLLSCLHGVDPVWSLSCEILGVRRGCAACLARRRSQQQAPRTLPSPRAFLCPTAARGP